MPTMYLARGTLKPFGTMSPDMLREEARRMGEAKALAQ
jgi:hypothetical protein